MQSHVLKRHPNKLLASVAAMGLVFCCTPQAFGQATDFDCATLEEKMWGGASLKDTLSKKNSADSDQLVAIDQYLDIAHFDFYPLVLKGDNADPFANQINFAGKMSLALLKSYMSHIKETVDFAISDSFSSCINKNLYRKYIIAALIAYSATYDATFLKDAEPYALILTSEKNLTYLTFWGLYANAMLALSRAAETKGQNDGEYEKYINDYEGAVHRLWIDVITKRENNNLRYYLSPKKNADLRNEAMSFVCGVDYDPDFKNSPNQLYRLMYLLVAEYPVIIHHVKVPHSLDVIIYHLAERFFCEPEKDDAKPNSPATYFTYTTVDLLKNNLRSNKKSDNLGVSFLVALNQVDQMKNKFIAALDENNYSKALLDYQKTLAYLDDLDRFAQSTKGKSWAQSERLNVYALWMGFLEVKFDAAINNSQTDALRDIVDRSGVIRQAAAHIDKTVAFYHEVDLLALDAAEKKRHQFNKLKAEKNIVLRDISTRLTYLSLRMGALEAKTRLPGNAGAATPGWFAYAQGTDYFSAILESFDKKIQETKTLPAIQSENVSYQAFYYAALVYKERFNQVYKQSAVADEATRALALKHANTSLRLFPFDIDLLIRYVEFSKQNDKGHLIGNLKRHYIELLKIDSIYNSSAGSLTGSESDFIKKILSSFLSDANKFSQYSRCTRPTENLQRNTQAQRICDTLLVAMQELNKLSSAIDNKYYNAPNFDDPSLSLLRLLITQKPPLPL